nr:DNA-binding response regulator [uncultured Roseateles sp.]
MKTSEFVLPTAPWPDGRAAASPQHGAFPEALQSPGNSACVLIVDEHAANLQVLQDVLEESGYNVAVARSVAHALLIAPGWCPDLVLLDQDLCAHEGMGQVSRLLAMPGFAHVPGILMGPRPDSEQVLAALEAGCVDTIPKPVRAREVLARVAVHVRGRREARQARQALDAFGHASLVLRSVDGARIWHTPLASQLMHFHFEVPEMVTPPSVLRWLRQSIASSQPGAMISARGGRRLELSLHGQTGDDEWLVMMRESSDAVLIDGIAQGLRLTLREAEVLYWVVKGKINRDIGAILGMSPQTVKKHLEHVFAKLGVETRTAAAAQALGRVRGLSN